MQYTRKTVYHKDKYGASYGTGTRHYNIWAGMKKRGTGKDTTNNYKYFDKGITICDDWLSYGAFAEWSVKNGYEDSLTIDRIDNSKGYFPENCRWATYTQQAHNKRTTPIYSYRGLSGPIPMWSDFSGVKRSTIKERIRLRGMSIEQACGLGGVSFL